MRDMRVTIEDVEAIITGMDIFPPMMCVQLLPPKAESEINKEVSSHVQEEAACQERPRDNEGAS